MQVVTPELYIECRALAGSLKHIPASHYDINCKEVTYRVYSFVTTSQGYPDILSCDLNKHVS